MATCYRHPNRETGVSCSSCGRPICPDCMTPTPVGMRCPECARQRTKVRTVRTPSGGTQVTMGLIVINVIFFLAEVTGGGGAINNAAVGRVGHKLELFGPAIAQQHEYWRLISSGFLHAGVFHILINMYLLWLLGQILEPGVGAVRFAAIYLVSLLAGSFGALVVTPDAPVVGASGAIFGLMGAVFLESRARGINPFQGGVFGSIGGLIVINLVLSVLLSRNISLGAHVGGLVGGVLAAAALRLGDRYRAQPAGLALCVLLAVGMVAGALAAASANGLPG